jgi:hypothetical protein
MLWRMEDAGDGKNGNREPEHAVEQPFEEK